MAWRVVLRPEVAGDINEAAAWYDEEEPGLGCEFTDEVFLALDAIAENPSLHSRRHPTKAIHWRYPNRFPYRIIYEIIEGDKRSSSPPCSIPRVTTAIGINQ